MHYTLVALRPWKPRSNTPSSLGTGHALGGFVSLSQDTDTMSCCIEGDGKVRMPPTTAKHHFSLETLEGAYRDTTKFGDPREKTAFNAEHPAGSAGLYTKPIATGYRGSGADILPPGISPEEECPRQCNLSGDYRGDYGGKNTLWFGTKGPTYTWQPKSQIEFNGHRYPFHLRCCSQ